MEISNDSNSTPDADPSDSKRARANRRNVQFSTGPRTAEGKAQSSRNPTKHGLSGKGKVLPPEMEAERARKLAAWMADLQPEDDLERELIEATVTASVRLHQCWREELYARSVVVERAEAAWQEDREAEVRRLISRFDRDFELVVPQLRRTLEGAKWLLDRWLLLGEVLERGKPWTEEHRALALNLLSVPTIFRDYCHKIDEPEGIDPSGLRLQVVQAQVDRLDALIEDACNR